MCRTEALLGVQDIRNGNTIKGIGRINKVAVVFALNAAMISAAAAVADAIREKLPFGYEDDDEDKDWTEYWLINFFANMKDNLNPLNMIPLVKEASGFKDGWGTQNMALEGADAMVRAVGNWEKYINGESKKTPAELMKKSAEAIGMVTGIPVKNMIREFESWTKLFGIDVHAATDEEEKPESEKTLLDKFKEWMGKSNTKDDTDEGKDTISYKEKLGDIKEASEGLSGEEKQTAIWKEATKNYTKAIESGDMGLVREMYFLLKDSGGDYETFDQKVEEKVKSSFKKCIGSDQAGLKIPYYKDYLMELGYSEGKIQQEIIHKSEAAKAFQEAAAFNDEEEMVNTCASLLQAGAKEEDIYILYETRSSGLDASDYSTGEMTFPTDGEISSGFGHRDSPGGIGSTDHKGIDIAAAAGTDVLAADGGKVSAVNYNSARGVYVEITHGNGRKTRYQHLDGYAVQKGDVIKKGQVIAYVGSTGNSTGPHLHFEVQEGDTYINPMTYFKL